MADQRNDEKRVADAESAFRRGAEGVLPPGAKNVGVSGGPALDNARPKMWPYADLDKPTTEKRDEQPSKEVGESKLNVGISKAPPEED